MDNYDFDIAILGAGPVGLALANSISSIAGPAVRIALFQGHLSFLSPQEDTRVLALNQGSRVFLEQHALWLNKSADIKTVHVSQKGRLGRTLITHEEMQVPRLGSMVSYAYLHQVLSEKIKQRTVQVLSGALASATPQAQGGVLISQGDKHYRARLAIQCDGLRAKDIQREYEQHALITSVRARYPQADWAWERFTQEGPLAVLPHPIFLGAQSLVWVTSPDKAQDLLALDERAFARALEAHFGDRLGSFTIEEKRIVFPLHLNVSTHIVQPSIVIIGNAAQTLHPVAGQGLNLGLRDVATLGQQLSPWFNDINKPVQPYLEKYAQARQIDRRITWELTDFLPRIFTTHNPLIEHACGLSLLSMDLIKPLRTPLATQLLQGYRP